jgi:tetratricopeptide (TPR) repeat protein
MTELLRDLVEQWKFLWAKFEELGPLANAIEILMFGGVAFGFMRWYFWRRLRNKEDQVVDLTDALARSRKKSDDLRTQLKDATATAEKLDSQLPQSVWAKVVVERDQGNPMLADRIVRDWIAAEGETIAALLMVRATWTGAHAVGDRRDMGLVAAAGYATAATVFRPKNDESEALLEDIRALQISEGQLDRPLTTSLAEFDRATEAVFETDLVRQAAEAVAEADRMFSRGHYHLALTLIDGGVSLRVQNLGKHAVQTLSAQQFRCSIMTHLGRDDEVLPLIQDVIQSQTDSPALGPTHPDTLISQLYLVDALRGVDRTDEALRLVKSVSEACAAHPALGPEHPLSLSSGSREADILFVSDRIDEALPLAKTVWEAQKASADLGPLHRNTLVNGVRLSQMLHASGRYDEAREITQDVLRSLESNAGREHSYTLVAKSFFADVLASLGEKHEALALARETYETMSASPAIGGHHPITLVTAMTIADIVNDLGRPHETLPIVRETLAILVAKRGFHRHHGHIRAAQHILAETLHGLGRDNEALQSTLQAGDHESVSRLRPQQRLDYLRVTAEVRVSLGRSEEALCYIVMHAEAAEAYPALVTRYVIPGRLIHAHVLHSLGRCDEALPMAEDAIKVMIASGVIGPKHPRTLIARELVPRILHGMGRHDDALQLARDAAADQEASPQIGPEHPVTLKTRSLVARILHSLGQTNEAIGIASATLAAQESHPSIGHDHPDTQATRALRAAIAKTIGSA